MIGLFSLFPSFPSIFLSAFLSLFEFSEICLSSQLYKFYSSPSIIRMIKARRMRWAGHEWGRGGVHIGYWWESRKDGNHWEDQDVGGWTILKWILER
jgi:apolipoprotein N-acyltransferase